MPGISIDLYLTEWRTCVLYPGRLTATKVTILISSSTFFHAGRHSAASAPTIKKNFVLFLRSADSWSAILEPSNAARQVSQAKRVQSEIPRNDKPFGSIGTFLFSLLLQSRIAALATRGCKPREQVRLILWRVQSEILQNGKHIPCHSRALVCASRGRNPF